MLSYGVKQYLCKNANSTLYTQLFNGLNLLHVGVSLKFLHIPAASLEVRQINIQFVL